MEITNNIHSLAQQLFQLIQQQEMEITINQQTIKYTNTRKKPQDKIWRKTENTVDKIMAKMKLLEILLNIEMNTVTVNQMGKLTNAQFKELQNKITQIILRKEVQELLKNGELELRNLGNLDETQY
ncbi:hypothetical protein G9A89_014900 [Geosiphon pyriformis]|nr:hypothetical protein G9A89_014900 [Geosiphon pyriformis]